MFTRDYEDAIKQSAKLAPSLEKASGFILWAEDICALLAYIYNKDYEQVTEDLYEVVKEYQDYVDDEEDN